MKVTNLPVIASNIGMVFRNRAGKLSRHVFSRFRRATKRSSERVKNTRTRIRQSAERGLDDVEHLRAGTIRAARYWDRLREQLFDPVRNDLSIKRELRAVAAGDGPIVVGPWLSEVGYEALYWTAFVRWFVREYDVDPGRLVVLSRGGVATWYADVTSNYVELLDLFAPDDFAERNRRRQESGDQKQLAEAEFDAEIFRRLRARGGAADAHVLHPWLMFRLLRRFWLGNATLEYALQHLRFAPVAAAPAAPAVALPDRFTAVKFYTGPAIPDTVKHRMMLRGIVERLSSQRPVVVLSTGLRLDEHEDFLFAGMANVVSLDAEMRPQINLGLQTEIIRRAALFVGTAGSLAWLAPLLGVDTIGVYADDRFLGPHFYAARYGYASVNGAGRFMPLDLSVAASFEFASTPVGKTANA